MHFCCYFEGSLAITLECNCNTVGSIDISCTNNGGACTCKTGYTGTKCNECADGWSLYNGECNGKFLLVLLTHLCLRHTFLKARPISTSDFHETSPKSIWAFYTSYKLTLTKKKFRLKAPFPRSQKRRIL